MAVIKRSDIYEGGATFTQIADQLAMIEESFYLNIINSLTKDSNRIATHELLSFKDNSICAYCGSIKHTTERCNSCGANLNM
jgi:hypothetical protein